MNAENSFKHLKLALKKTGKKRRRKNDFPQIPIDVKQNKANRAGHSGFLYNKASRQIERWSELDEKRLQNNLPNLPADRSLLIKIPPEEMDLDFLRTSLGLEVVCEYDDGLVIVATNPEVFIKNLDKIKGFAEGAHATGSIAKIYDIVTEETKEERLKRILSEDLYLIWNDLIAKPDHYVVIETSIECLGKTVVPDVPKKKKDETDEKYDKRMAIWQKKRANAYDDWDELCRIRQAEIDDFIACYQGEVLAIYDYADEFSKLDSFELKLKIPVKCLVDFAENYPYVFEITFPEEFSYDLLKQHLDEASNVGFELKAPDEDSPIVCIIDSGIQEGHIYLNKAIVGELSKSYLPNDPLVLDEVDEGGHGTRVAGAVLFPNGVSNIIDEYKLACYIANARVLNKDNSMPAEILPSKLINDIVKDYNVNQGIRLFNHSVASNSPCRRKYMSSWATTIDNASFERDLLFLQAAGNLYSDSKSLLKMGIRQHLNANRDYPQYLLEDVSRIANPAQSTQALTVGSICCGEYEDNDLKSFGITGAISSFSRSGFGLWKSIKPEVVECGGDWIRSKHNNNTFITKSEICPELIRRSPEGPAYAKDTGGTSFATPKVAYIAAQVQKILPNESALLYKALIVHSASWTPWTENLPEGEYLNVLRYMGYGLPSLTKATTNDEHRVTYITTGDRHIKGGNIHVFRIKVPNEIKGLNAEIRIDVTLTFSAKPRRTRKGFKGYFSTWVDWESSKFNENLEAFANRVLESEQDDDGAVNISNGKGFTWTIGLQDNHGKIKGINRNRSATQKDWIEMPAYELPEEFCIAVRGHNGWSKNGEHFAKYALVVGFEAVNKDIEIYVPFSLLVEAEVEVEQEIETEIEVEDIV